MSLSPFCDGFPAVLWPMSVSPHIGTYAFLRRTSPSLDPLGSNENANS